MAEVRRQLDTLITLEATGSRDVWWCQILNEPIIIQYADGERGPAAYAHCTGCGWTCDTERAEDDPAFLSMHDFCFHICKPYV